MKEVYFPMEALRVTQGYGVVHDNVAADTYSHKGTYALDLGGADTGADWLVAPFACTVKRVYGTYNAVWFESDEVYEPLGCKLIMLCLHMNRADLKALGIAAGKHFALGERCYREGRAGNVTGTHVHLEIGKGPFTGTGWHKNARGVWEINNKLIPNEIFRLCPDVKILNGHGYTWLRRAAAEKPKSAAEEKQEGSTVQSAAAVQTEKQELWKPGDQVYPTIVRQVQEKSYAQTWNGGRFRVWYKAYTVRSVCGQRVVLEANGKIAAAVQAQTLKRFEPGKENR